MTSSSGGEAIVSGLVAHGVDTVFGLPGAQIYGLFDAFQQAQLKVIGARHEQACGYMAYGYARSTGRPGVFSVVPGPGVLNAGAALLTAFGSNEPVLCLTGQVPTQFLGKGRGHLHEMPDQLATLRTFVKWAERIEYPDDAPTLVSRAFQEMLSGRRGPVALEMPWDVFTQRAETGAAKPFDPFPAPQPDTDRIKAAAALIAGSKTPMIFVGSGAIDARDEILELAELIDAPVVAFRSGRGIVSNAHELGLTMAAAYRLWPQHRSDDRHRHPAGIADHVALAVPARRPEIDPHRYRSGRKCAGSRPMPPSIADAKAGTARTARRGAARPATRKTSGRRAAIREASAAALQEIQSDPAADGLPEHPARGAAARTPSSPTSCRRSALPPGTAFRSISRAPSSPRAIRARSARAFRPRSAPRSPIPDRPVVAITGDGGFMFGVQELATAVQFNIGVVTLVFNNNAYGNVRRDQRERFDGRVVASDLVNPDFVKLAESFGVGAARVTSPEAFRPALEKALAHGGPYLIAIEVPRDSETTPWAFIHPAKP